MNKPTSKNEMLGALVASAVAGMILAAPALADHAKGAEGKAEMYCSNGCKGTSACGGHGNDNGCMNSNSCKGHGFLEAKDAAECKTKGGTWKRDEKSAPKKDEKSGPSKSAK